MFVERLDTLFTSSDSKIFGFTRPHFIGFVADFPPWIADFFFLGFAVEFAECVWTVAVSGKKKLRIQKYPDGCGGGLIVLVAMAVNVRYKSLHISLPSSVKQEREMNKFCVNYVRNVDDDG